MAKTPNVNEKTDWMTARIDNSGCILRRGINTRNFVKGLMFLVTE